MSDISVFISSRQNELEQERFIAKSILSDSFNPIIYEDEPASGESSREWCINKINESNIFLLILYKTISDIVKDEFFEARKIGIPIIVLIKSLSSGDTRDKNLIDFIENDIYKYVKPQHFDDNDDFSREIMESFNNLLGNSSQLDKISSVYVKPFCYYKTTSIRDTRCIIIIGSAHIGKTAMAKYLQMELFVGKEVKFMHEFHDPKNISFFKAYKDSAILIDDAFGSTDFKDAEIADHLRELLEISELNNNYIIITSRKEIFNETLRKSKIKEDLNTDDFLLAIDNSDYSRDLYLEMLKKHIEWYNVDGSIKDLISANVNPILSKLQFPHNIDFFSKECSSNVFDLNSLKKAVEISKKIEVAVENYFLNLDKNLQNLYIVVTAFEGIPAELFDYVYNQGMDALNADKLDFSYLKSKSSSYVIFSDKVRFLHSSYFVGTLNGIKKERFESYFKVILNFIPDDNSLIQRYAIQQLFLFDCKFNSRAIWETIEKCITEIPDENKPNLVILLSTLSEDNPEIFPILKTFLKDSNMMVQAIAAQGLFFNDDLNSENYCSFICDLIKKNDGFTNLTLTVGIRDILDESQFRAFLPCIKELIAINDEKLVLLLLDRLGTLVEQHPTIVLPLLEEIIEKYASPEVINKSINVTKKSYSSRPFETMNIIGNWVGKVMDLQIVGLFAFQVNPIVYVSRILPIVSDYITNSEYDEVRIAATYILHHIGKSSQEEVLPLLKELTNNKDPQISCKASIVCSDLISDYSETLALFDRMLESKCPYGRLAIIGSINGIVFYKFPEELIPYLQKLSIDDFIVVRSELCSLLKDYYLDEIPCEFFTILNKLSNDISPNVRENAHFSLLELSNKRNQRI